jgi:hypothetical protein
LGCMTKGGHATFGLGNPLRRAPDETALRIRGSLHHRLGPSRNRLPLSGQTRCTNEPSLRRNFSPRILGRTCRGKRQISRASFGITRTSGQ